MTCFTVTGFSVLRVSGSLKRPDPHTKGLMLTESLVEEKTSKHTLEMHRKPSRGHSDKVLYKRCSCKAGREKSGLVICAWEAHSTMKKRVRGR